MLSDRPYMRDDYPRERTSPLIWLLCAIVAGFTMQWGAAALWPNGDGSLLNQLGLTSRGLKEGHVWTLFTHSFLHHRQFLPHVLFNVVALYFLGREMLPVLGTKRFLGLYFGATIVGALFWATAHWGSSDRYYGASAGIAALLVAFACFFPQRPLSFLFLFFPVTLKPKHLAIGLVALDIMGLLAFELGKSRLPYGFVPGSSAHLGGIFTAWVYFRYLHDAPWRFGPGEPRIDPPRVKKRLAKAEVVLPPVPALDLSNPHHLRMEVDRILDKINSEGLRSLTSREKKILDGAKDLLSGR